MEQNIIMRIHCNEKLVAVDSLEKNEILAFQIVIGKERCTSPIPKGIIETPNLFLDAKTTVDSFLLQSHFFSR
jgi:hypothetical protein